MPSTRTPPQLCGDGRWLGASLPRRNARPTAPTHANGVSPPTIRASRKSSDGPPRRNLQNKLTFDRYCERLGATLTPNSPRQHLAPFSNDSARAYVWRYRARDLGMWLSGHGFQWRKFADHARSKRM